MSNKICVIVAALILAITAIMTLSHASFDCNLIENKDPAKKNYCDVILTAFKSKNQDPQQALCDGRAVVTQFDWGKEASLTITCPWKGYTVVLDMLAVILALIFTVGAVLRRSGKQIIPDKIAFFLGVGSLLLLVVTVATMFMTPKVASNACDNIELIGATYCIASSISYNITAILTVVAIIILAYDVFVNAKKDMDSPAGLNTSYLVK